ncbi:MAG: thiol:disulfide interchange protein DsbA/DsbL [Panacagrimonas sp.]
MRGLMRALVASLALSIAMFSVACSAEDKAANYEEGKQYKSVRTVAKPIDPKRITVEEFFWYGCQHCYHFESEIGPWVAKRKPADVDFIRIPASLGRPEGTAHQKAFYTASALGFGDKIHKPLFDGIHEKRLPLFTQEALATFFNQQTGVLPDVFNGTFSGFAVDSQVRRAETLAKDYAISSVPSVVVGGKYQTDSTRAGSFPQALEVVDFLIEKIRQERKK